jgi:TRAP-type C4-dicarboxylate transport system permease large subunit
VPSRISASIVGLDVSPIVIVVLLLLVMLPLGMFLEPIAILLIVAPLAYPTVTALGFDGVWFGILMVKMVELAMITPPVGLNAFVVAGAADDMSVEQVFRGIVPFGLADVATLALLIAFPSLVLWLPGLIR